MSFAHGGHNVVTAVRFARKGGAEDKSARNARRRVASEPTVRRFESEGEAKESHRPVPLGAVAYEAEVEPDTVMILPLL